MLKNKKVIAFTIIALLLITVVVLLFSSRTDNTTSPAGRTPISSTAPKSITMQSPEEINVVKKDEGYFLNKTASQTNVITYGWSDDNLIYVNNQGVHNANKQKTIFSASLSAGAFNSFGTGIVKSDSAWKFFNTKDDTERDLSIPLSNAIAKINESGDKILFYSDKTAIIADTTTAKTNTKQLDSTIVSADWTNNDNVYLLIKVEETQTLEIRNKDLEIVYSKNIPSTSKVQDINLIPPQLILSETNVLHILTSKDFIETLQFTFQGGSEIIAARFINSSELVAVERMKADDLGRKIENVWKISLSGKTTFLADSKPIARRLSDNQPLIPNPGQTFIPLIEKNGVLWLVSLIPNQLPFISQDGSGFMPLPSPMYSQGEGDEL